MAGGCIGPRYFTSYVPNGPSTNIMWARGFSILQGVNIAWAKYSRILPKLMGWSGFLSSEELPDKA